MKGLREHPPGSGRYELAFYDKERNPKRKYKRFQASSLDNAERIAHKMRDAYERGDDDPWTDKKISIPEAMRLYMKAHRNQRPNTISSKKTALELFSRYVRVTSFSAITEKEIAIYAVHFKRPNTLSNRINVIGHFWQWAIDEGYAKKDPVKTYKRKNKIGRRVSAHKTLREAITPDEYRGIYNFVKSEHIVRPRMRSLYILDFMELCISTGLRISEATSLNLRDIRLADDGVTGSIHIREWINPRTGEHFVPKHERERIVPLTPRAAQVLSRVISGITEDEWQPIFLNEIGHRFDPQTVSPRFKEARRGVGLGSSITFHSTRHSFLTWLIMLSVDPYAVMKVAGHGNLQTQQRYIHYKDVMLSGGANEMRRAIIEYLCPGLPDGAVDLVYPDKAAWYGSLEAPSSLPVLDVLFGGTLYKPAFVSALKQRRIGSN